MDCIGFSRFGTGRHGRWLVALLLCSLACTLAAAPPTPPRRAAPATLRPATDGQRFLFVVDISSSMRDTDAANRQALFDMIFTGLDGQMRSGDTFGLWLYNDKVHAGTFPMQIWDEKDPLPVASLATKYLRDQAYSGRSRPDVLMPRLLNLIKNVRDVNVMVISRGKPALQGTPFDTNIAAIVQRKRSEREKEQKPFITALVARGGTIVNGGVVIAGEPLPLPERPATMLAAKGTNSPAQPSNATATLNSVPRSELSSTGTKPETRTPEPGIATANPEPSPQATAALTLPTPPPPKPKVFEFVTRTSAVLTNLAAAPATTLEKAIPSSESSAPGFELQAPSFDLSRTGAEPGTRNPEPEAATANPQPRRPTNPDAAPANPIAATLASLADSLDAKPVPVAARSPAANATSVTAAAVVAPAPGPSAALLLTIGIVLLAACVGLLLLVLHKLRPRRQGSFITQSMESR